MRWDTTYTGACTDVPIAWNTRQIPCRDGWIQPMQAAAKGRIGRPSGRAVTLQVVRAPVQAGVAFDAANRPARKFHDICISSSSVGISQFCGRHTSNDEFPLRTLSSTAQESGGSPWWLLGIGPWRPAGIGWDRTGWTGASRKAMT
jgi:hypothetical protein